MTSTPADVLDTPLLATENGVMPRVLAARYIKRSQYNLSREGCYGAYNGKFRTYVHFHDEMNQPLKVRDALNSSFLVRLATLQSNSTSTVIRFIEEKLAERGVDLMTEVRANDARLKTPQADQGHMAEIYRRTTPPQGRWVMQPLDKAGFTPETVAVVTAALARLTGKAGPLVVADLSPHEAFSAILGHKGTKIAHLREIHGLMTKNKISWPREKRGGQRLGPAVPKR